MFKFLVDTQLPPVLAKFLRSKGVNAVHTTYFAGGELMSDYAIRLNAVSDDRIIITKDSDFLDNYLIHGVPPKVLMLQFGNISNADLLILFETNLANIEKTFLSGADFITFNRTHISVY